MKEYEVIREIPNSCSNNQMRDISFEEIETDSPVDYVKAQFPDKHVDIRTDRQADGALIVYATVSETIHKYIFTEI